MVELNLFFLLVLQKQAAILKFFLSNTKFLDRALYARHEIVYCQQKFTNHCLIVLLENKSTEMLKILSAETQLCLLSTRPQVLCFSLPSGLPVTLAHSPQPFATLSNSLCFPKLNLPGVV